MFRAAGLADRLNSASGMYLNVLILVSGVLDFGTIWGQTGNDLPYALILPVCVGGALAGHVILTRALLLRKC